MSSNADLAVQSTCTDASSSKKYAVQKGYWIDNFINFMVRSSPKTKQPEINLGYYARTEAIWILLNKFLKATNDSGQIVSLGAGLDTTFWRLSEQGTVPQRYVELDFEAIVRSKISTIKSKSPLNHVVFGTNSSTTVTSSIVTERYSLLSADLRNLNEVGAALKSDSIDFSLPTLFFAECVLIYMPSSDSNALIKWISDSFKNSVFINYEQNNMQSNFGKVMIQNLKKRECDLPGVDMCESLDVQKHRFMTCGWEDVNCMTMWSVFHSLPDVARIKRLEFLDEMELLEQLLTHYCLCIAVNMSIDSDIDLISIAL